MTSNLLICFAGNTKKCVCFKNELIFSAIKGKKGHVKMNLKKKRVEHTKL